MMNRNRQCIKNNELLTKIDQVVIANDYKIIKTLSNEDNLAFKYGEYYYLLHSNYSPEVEAKLWCRSIPENVNFVIIVGLGFAYHINCLRKLRPTLKIIIIEPNIMIFKKALECIDLEKILKDDNIILIVENNKLQIEEKLVKILNKNIITDIHFSLFTSYYNVYSKLLNDIMNAIKLRLMIHTQNVVTEIYFNELYIVNLLNNLYEVENSCNGSLLDSLSDNIPSVIVSAGPSLEKNIDQLAKVKDKCIIISVGSSINILYNHDIIPNFWVVIDGDPLVKNMINNIDTKKTNLVYLNLAYYEVIKQFQGKKFLFSHIYDNIGKYMLNNIEIPAVEIGVSVASLGLQLANYMKGYPVVFLGQDLALKNMKVYSPGAVNESIANENIIEEELIEIKDIYGEKTYTRNEFLTMRKTLENIMNSSPKNTYINATEGGIGFTNQCINMNFSEVIDKYFDKGSTIGNEINLKLSSMKKIKLTYRIEDLLLESIDIGRQLIKLTEQREDECKKIRKGSVNIKNALAKIDDITDLIEKNIFYITFVYTFIQSMIRSDILLCQKRLSNHEENNIHKVINIKVKSVQSQNEKINSYTKKVIQYLELMIK